MNHAYLLEWLRAKLDDAERALAARKQMESAWRNGSETTWNAVGCKMKKAQRLKVSEMQGRIAKKCKRDVRMFKSVIAICKTKEEKK